MKNKRPIYVICPDRKTPIGGVKQLYSLVDSLNALGHEAYILHKKKNFRVTWYKNETPIVHFPGVFKRLNRHRKHPIMRLIETLIFGKRVPEKGSIIVFPEVYGPYINLFEEYQLVIFNQNCYYTFDRAPEFEPSISPYTNKNLLGCMVVSEDSKQYLSYFFPHLKVERIRLGLSDHFSYAGQKKKKLAFMPRKLAEDANQVYHYFADKACFKDWEFAPIDGLNEEQVADVLKESAIFLCFNHREGFGLPPVEAMACGCYVIGYAGNAGNEYFDPQFSTPIADRNVLQFIKEVEKTINLYNVNPQEIIEKGLKASAFVTNNYHQANELEDTKRAWNALCEPIV